MTAAIRLVPAVGGTRSVAAPDPVAADYILLGLRLDQHIRGLVDAYYGPADLKARVDMEQPRAPALLASDAAALAERADREVTEPDRKAWFSAQLVALEALARVISGEALPYTELVERCMGFAPSRRVDAVFDEAATAIDALLPGPGSLAFRLAAWDRSLEIPVDRLDEVAAWLVGRFRATADAAFGLPAREDVRISLVRNQPWSAYNWYDGGRRSRIDINTDLPVHGPALIATAAHETYPGHHLEHAWKEADLVDGLGRLEASILLVNTHESPISEGLADVGVPFVAPRAERADLLVEMFDRAGITVAVNGTTTRETAERALAIADHRETLRGCLGTAAFLRHADGATHDAVLAYLQDVGRYSPDVAAKRLEFIEHPLWRTYVFVYAEGAALLERWIEAAAAPDRVGRFGRLLHEQVTPGRLLAELG
jgi:hypothetical protein